MNAMTSQYAGALETAPWNTAPVIFALFKDLVYDTYDGDYERISEEASIIIGQINPFNGSLTAAQDFYDRFQAFYDELYHETTGKVKAILDSYSLSHETEYVLSIGDGTLWPTSLPLYNECDSDGDCGTDEECKSGKCSTVASERMSSMSSTSSLSTGYGGTKCTSDDDCDEAFECYKETETSLGECTPRMAELYT